VTTAAPPRLRANPVLGSALDLRRSRIRTYMRAMREHGDVVRLAVGPPGVRFDLYCVFHPDGVGAVLAGSREGYSKGTRFYRQIAEAFGWGLLTSEGDRWQRQRRLIQPLFTRKQIASYSELMAEEAAAVAGRWDRAARNGGVVDANAEMVRLALAVVGRAIFGDDVAKARDVIDSAFGSLDRHVSRRAASPLAAPASWPTRANRRAARARAAAYGVVDELIAERKRAGADGDELLSRLLGARDQETGEAMDVQQVRDEALIFLLAGHETTSTALTFTLHLLGRHPREQWLVHDEIDAILDGQEPTIDEVPALERTARAIKEAMRLSARLRSRPASGNRPANRRLHDPGRLLRRCQPIRHPSAPAPVGEPRGVRPRALHT
jgi:cytochrome P450